MFSSIGNAVSGVADKIKSFLHFSRPDEGPLRDYEKWMPDMVKGLSKTLKESSPELYNQSKKLSKKIVDGFDLTSLYNKMQATVSVETQKSSQNLTASTVAKANKEVSGTNNTNNSRTIHCTQNFYEKNPTPYEEQKQAKRQLRRLAYEI